jgi:predicted HTH transcriptional regulator
MNSIKAKIALGENQTQDFKFRIDDQKKIARTLVAFANTDGGSLLIGVKDNGKITGINPEEEFHMIEGAATLFCKPAVAFETKVWQEDFRLVLEVIVPVNPQRNHTAKDEDDKWKVYIRREDNTVLANKILIQVWNFQRKGIQKPQELSDEAIQVLKELEKQPDLTLSKLYRLVNLPKNRVDYWLALFVYWENVDMLISPDQTTYRIN